MPFLLHSFGPQLTCLFPHLIDQTFLPPRNATDDDEVEETKVQAPPTSEEGAPFLCEMKDARYLTVGGRSSERRVIHAEMKPIAAKAPPVPFKVRANIYIYEKEVSFYAGAHFTTYLAS